MLLNIFLEVFSEYIKHSAKYIILKVATYYRGNTCGFLLLWLLFQVIYFCIQLKGYNIKQTGISIICSISPFVSQHNISVAIADIYAAIY